VQILLTADTCRQSPAAATPHPPSQARSPDGAEDDEAEVHVVGAAPEGELPRLVRLPGAPHPPADPTDSQDGGAIL